MVDEDADYLVGDGFFAAKTGNKLEVRMMQSFSKEYSPKLSTVGL